MHVHRHYGIVPFLLASVPNMRFQYCSMWAVAVVALLLLLLNAMNRLNEGWNLLYYVMIQKASRGNVETTISFTLANIWLLTPYTGWCYCWTSSTALTERFYSSILSSIFDLLCAQKKMDSNQETMVFVKSTDFCLNELRKYSVQIWDKIGPLFPSPSF